jgi:hypothetical protein
VNADEDEFVFHTEGGSVVGIEAHADLAFEEFFEREPAREIAQREIVVQLDEQLRFRPGKKILSGDFSGVDGGDGNSSLVTGREHQFSGAANVALANEQIEVSVAAHRGVVVGLHREHGAFYDKRGDFLRGELIQNSKKFRAQLQGVKNLFTPAIHEGLMDGCGDGAIAQFAQRCGEMAHDTVILSESEQPGPIHGRNQEVEFFRSGYGGGAREEQSPFVLERIPF